VRIVSELIEGSSISWVLCFNLLQPRIAYALTMFYPWINLISYCILQLAQLCPQIEISSYIIFVTSSVALCSWWCQIVPRWELQNHLGRQWSEPREGTLWARHRNSYCSKQWALSAFSKVSCLGKCWVRVQTRWAAGRNANQTKWNKERCLHNLARKGWGVGDLRGSCFQSVR